MKRNASLSYEIGDVKYGEPIWVTTLTQEHTLSGSTSQSRYTRVFYPRAYMPGDVAVEGICRSQNEYQDLSRFIRKHHRALLSTPSTETFAQNDTSSPGYKRLLKLSVPSEGIAYRGYINSFAISKKGYFDPAPTFNFNFTVVYDPHSIDVHQSQEVQKYYEDISRYYSPDQTNGPSQGN